MKKRVFKYVVQDSPQYPSRSVVTMPKYAQVVHTGLDPDDHVCVWALVDPTDDDIVVEFVTTWTGEWVPDEITSYMGMIQKDGIILHVWGLGEMK